MVENKYVHNLAFKLESGEYLYNLEITYHTLGKLNSLKNNVVWVCHALTANSNVADWWNNMVGKDKFYDPKDYFIICANIIGSCYGTTGPLSINLSTKAPYYNNFPLITIRDMVNAHDILRNYLNINSIHTLIGSSIGAFQVLEWSIIQPDIFKHIVFIASSCKVTPWATALNESQRMAIENDSSFFMKQPNGGLEGMKTARSIALLSYRSYLGYNTTQQEPDNEFLLASKSVSYQRYQGEKLAKRFNAYSYYCLTKSIDTHNIGRGRGGVEKALSFIKARTLLISISSDILFPPGEMKYMNNYMPNSTYKNIHSIFGHDGFLIEFEQLQQTITNFYKNN